MMSSLDMARRYLDVWNARDADAIVRTFAEGGTSRDPTTGDIAGDAIGDQAMHLWDAFPDLRFEIVSMAEAGAGRIVVEWIRKGTNTGAFQGLPATGRAVSLPGVDVIETGADGIKTVRGYFDARAVPDQLGLQVLVQPFQVGPFSFGTATALQSGKKTKPGAFGITTIWNDDAQTEDIRALTRAIATEMLNMDGCIGVSFFRVGGRGVTMSAWEHPEHAKQLRRGGAHSEAMRRFWTGSGDSAHTSVWIPDHTNPLWVRCRVCRKMNGYETIAAVGSCGERLPEAPSCF
jgi:steroid delta-isomerase-like uncharacterized protein